MRGKRSIIVATLLVSLAGCAAPSLHWRDEAYLTLSRVRQEGAEQYFPAEVKAIEDTLTRGESMLRGGDAESVDELFQFAVVKGRFLEAKIVEEKQRQHEAVSRRLEEERQERERLQRLEEERKAREEAERKQKEDAEAAALQARKQAERSKLLRERPLPSYHTVKRGETLPQIAAQDDVYSDTSLWPLIYRANRDQISDPRRIWPGQVLKIPRNYSREDVTEARRYAREKQLF